MNIIDFPFELYREKHIDMAEHRFSFDEYVKRLNIYNDFIFHNFILSTVVYDDNKKPVLALEFIVEFNPDKEQLLLFEVKETEVGKKPTVQKYQWNHKENDYSTGVCMLLPPPQSETERDRKIAADMARVLLFAMTYIMDSALKRNHKNKAVYSNSYKYSRKHKISTTKRKVYLLDDIINYTYINYDRPKEKHCMSCPCWEVRGHYRHYKNGKTVFIRSYRKGKDRTKQPEDKRYYL